MFSDMLFLNAIRSFNKTRYKTYVYLLFGVKFYVAEFDKWQLRKSISCQSLFQTKLVWLSIMSPVVR